MQDNWQDFLLTQHAVINHDQVAHFGDHKTELQHTQRDTIITDLSHIGLLCFSGEDAQTFLQSQLTCDVKLTNSPKAQYGSYCTPKGRVLANFILWQKNDTWVMQFPASLCAIMKKKLSMFILRSKVNINECSEQWIRIGIAGPQASHLVEEITQETLNSGLPLDLLHTPKTSILYHTPNRIELIASPDEAQILWNTLSENARPVGADCWNWLEIQSGIPAITTTTQEQFLPQMINLDVIGGISFKKGCYPGQEIVARTQYLGKLKRRMYLANIISDAPVLAGDDLYSTGLTDQACGKLVNVAPSPNGGYDVLAVIQQSSAATETIHWKSQDGPVLNVHELPYTSDLTQPAQN